MTFFEFYIFRYIADKKTHTNNNVNSNGHDSFMAFYDYGPPGGLPGGPPFGGPPVGGPPVIGHGHGPTDENGDANGDESKSIYVYRAIYQNIVTKAYLYYRRDENKNGKVVFNGWATGKNMNKKSIIMNATNNG